MRSAKSGRPGKQRRKWGWSTQSSHPLIMGRRRKSKPLKPPFHMCNILPAPKVINNMWVVCGREIFGVLPRMQTEPRFLSLQESRRVAYIMDYHRDNVELSFLRNFDAHLQDHPTQYELTLINWKVVLASAHGAAAVEDGEGYTKPFCLLEERRMGTNGAKRGEWRPAHQFDIPPSLSLRQRWIDLLQQGTCVFAAFFVTRRQEKIFPTRRRNISCKREDERARTQDCGER